MPVEVRSPGAIITGGCEESSVGARNQTWVLCKNSKLSSEPSLQPPTHSHWRILDGTLPLSFGPNPSLEDSLQ